MGCNFEHFSGKQNWGCNNDIKIRDMWKTAVCGCGPIYPDAWQKLQVAPTFFALWATSSASTFLKTALDSPLIGVGESTNLTILVVRVLGKLPLFADLVGNHCLFWNLSRETAAAWDSHSCEISRGDFLHSTFFFVLLSYTERGCLFFGTSSRFPVAWYLVKVRFDDILCNSFFEEHFHITLAFLAFELHRAWVPFFGNVFGMSVLQLILRTLGISTVGKRALSR